VWGVVECVWKGSPVVVVCSKTAICAAVPEASRSGGWATAQRLLSENQTQAKNRSGEWQPSRRCIVIGAVRWCNIQRTISVVGGTDVTLQAIRFVTRARASIRVTSAETGEPGWGESYRTA